jgi:hypothetical protein
LSSRAKSRDLLFVRAGSGLEGKIRALCGIGTRRILGPSSHYLYGIGELATLDELNKLYYGDNLTVLRNVMDDESVDLIYLDPPFNSQATYNVLFKSTSGEKSHAQIEAFDDTGTGATRPSSHSTA